MSSVYPSPSSVPAQPPVQQVALPGGGSLQMSSQPFSTGTITPGAVPPLSAASSAPGPFQAPPPQPAMPQATAWLPVPRPTLTAGPAVPPSPSPSAAAVTPQFVKETVEDALQENNNALFKDLVTLLKEDRATEAGMPDRLPDEPETYAERVGQKTGDFVTRMIEQNPQLEEKLQQANAENLLDNPDSALSRFRDRLQQTRTFRWFRPFLKRFGKLMTNALPAEFEDDARAILKWLMAKPSKSGPPPIALNAPPDMVLSPDMPPAHIHP
ncbi:MAG: hypothetical protein AB7P76_01745 [Candidatus Melainabacteria bacterium]